MSDSKPRKKSRGITCYIEGNDLSTIHLFSDCNSNGPTRETSLRYINEENVCSDCKARQDQNAVTDCIVCGKTGLNNNCKRCGRPMCDEHTVQPSPDFIHCTLCPDL